jgi:hypothetical protein
MNLGLAARFACGPEFLSQRGNPGRRRCCLPPRGQWSPDASIDFRFLLLDLLADRVVLRSLVGRQSSVADDAFHVQLLACHRGTG